MCTGKNITSNYNTEEIFKILQTPKTIRLEVKKMVFYEKELKL